MFYRCSRIFMYMHYEISIKPYNVAHTRIDHKLVGVDVQKSPSKVTT